MHRAGTSLSVLFLLIIGSGPALFISVRAHGAAKPNILILLADDQTWRDVGCYGNKEVRTPHIDRLASQGLKFNFAFTATAMCSPTRQQLYTGLFPVRNGAYPNHSQVKPGTKSIVHHLRALGYRVGLSGKRHIGPGESFPFDGVRNLGQYMKAEAKPFCLIMASHQPHLPWAKPDGFDPSKLTIPPYLVDTPASRIALASYYTDIKQLDDEVAKALDALDQSGKAENTIVIFTSEQGSSFPFAKWTCYDLGLRTAFIVRWPGVTKAGSTTDAMIRYVDLVPTLVEAAGGDPAKIDTGRTGAANGGNGFDGRSFLAVLKGQTDKHAQFTYGVHTTAGIIAGKPYPIRSIRDSRYKYITNLIPDTSFHNTVIAQDKANYWRSWVEKAKQDPFAAERVNSYQRRPAEEFYDLESDPFEMKNLAGQPDQRKRMDSLRHTLEAWMKQQGDLGVETETARKRKKRKDRDTNQSKKKKERK